MYQESKSTIDGWKVMKMLTQGGGSRLTGEKSLKFHKKKMFHLFKELKQQSFDLLSKEENVSITNRLHPALIDAAANASRPHRMVPKLNQLTLTLTLTRLRQSPEVPVCGAGLYPNC